MKYPPRHDILGKVWMDEKFISLLFSESSPPGVFFDPDCDPDDINGILLPLMTGSACHHGEPKTGEFPLSLYFTAENSKDLSAYISAAWSLFCSSQSHTPDGISVREENFLKTGRISWVIAGLIILADWIASGSQKFEFFTQPMDLYEYWTTKALPSAKEAVIETGLPTPPVSSYAGISALFPEISKPNGMQLLTETCPLGEGSRLIILEDLCGTGKTEAALVLAHRLMNKGSEGIFFALPTMATANAMYSRIKVFYERLYDNSDRIAHLELTHSASKVMKRDLISFSKQGSTLSKQNDEHDGRNESVSWLSDSRKKALLAHVGVGTIDQALMGVLPIRHQSLRILGMCRNVLIIDEVHSYDPYMQTLICTLIEFQAGLGGSVILISATLPLIVRQNFAKAFQKGVQGKRKSLESREYPLLTVLSENEDPKEYVLESSSPDAFQTSYEIKIVSKESEAEEIIREITNSGLCVAWIRNTVSDAVDTYRRLAERFDPEKVSLFHARFTLHDRYEIENEVINTFGKCSTIEQRAGKILIATQVLEQSLDVDFDLLITDLAPVELMIQRAGRVHRHHLDSEHRSPNRGPARLVIFSPSVEDEIRDDWYLRVFPRGASVYPDHGNLFLSLEAMLNRKKILLPDDLRPMIEEVYGSDSNEVEYLSRIPGSLKKSTLKEIGRKNGDASMGMMNALSFSEGYVYDGMKWADDVHTPTRLSDQSVPIYLGYVKNGDIFPIYGEGSQGWMLSKVFLREGQLARADGDEQISGGHVMDFPEERPGVHLVVMCPTDGGWIGSGWNEKEKRVEVRYNVNEGFLVTIKGKDDE